MGDDVLVVCQNYPSNTQVVITINGKTYEEGEIKKNKVNKKYEGKQRKYIIYVYL